MFIRKMVKRYKKKNGEVSHYVYYYKYRNVRDGKRVISLYVGKATEKEYREQKHQKKQRLILKRSSMQELTLEKIRETWDKKHNPWEILDALERIGSGGYFVLYPRFLAMAIKSGEVMISKNQALEIWGKCVDNYLGIQFENGIKNWGMGSLQEIIDSQIVNLKRIRISRRLFAESVGLSPDDLPINLDESWAQVSCRLL